MEDDNNNVGGGLRTRSKLSPDWTVEESSILVNEVTAVETDCGDTLESFQKWKIIVENCNAMGVNRNLNQCRRKWESLLSDYEKIKQSGSKKATFNNDLFNLIELYVNEFEEVGIDQDNNSDPGVDVDMDMDMNMEPEPVLASIMKSVSAGSKKRRSKIKTEKRSKENTSKPKRYIKSEEIAVEEDSSEPKHDTSNLIMRPEGVISRDMQEQILAEKLRENAELIEAIVKQDSMNESSTVDSTRRDGDRLIDCLGNLVVALDQLSKFVQ